VLVGFSNALVHVLNNSHAISVVKSHFQLLHIVFHYTLVHLHGLWGEFVSCYGLVCLTFASSCVVLGGKQLQKCRRSSAIAAWCLNTCCCCSEVSSVLAFWSRPPLNMSDPPGARCGIAEWAWLDSTSYRKNNTADSASQTLLW
jgi:hypothetical protein